MPTAAEASGADTPLGGDLAEGVKSIAIQQHITFTLYSENILPLDGHRFWVKVYPVTQRQVLGSLHYATEIHQDTDQTFAQNRVVFTSIRDILNPLNNIAPKTMWIGEWQGLQFAFSGRGKYYEQAELHHYYGIAVTPDMRTQIVNSAGELGTKDVVVSNSLPLWLALNNYVPSIGGLRFAIPCILYPADLLPLNIDPPFASVDILAGSTTALQSTPYLGKDGSHFQLVSDRVRITTTGLRNAQALRLQDAINQYSLDFDLFGIMNMPVMNDVRSRQAETLTIAQKKVIEFEVSYHQYTARNIARQLITKVITTYFPQKIGS